MRRQLSVPLMDMEGTYQEVRQWFDEEKAHHICDMETIESGYKKALDKLSRILTFEESLVIKIWLFIRDFSFGVN